MKTPKRKPVEPSPKFARSLEKASKSGDKLEVDGITIVPPTPSHINWRVKVFFRSQLIERSGGKSLGMVNAAFLEVKSILDSLHSGAMGLPEHGDQQLADVIIDYIEQGGKDNIWKQGTKDDREDDFNHLIKLGREQKLTCAEMRPSHLRTYLTNATKTATRGKHLLGVLRTFVTWGNASGYFSTEQLQQVSQVKWTPPKGSTYRAAPNRRQQSKLYFGTTESAGGEVPTHDQVIAFAKACQPKFPYGEGFIHTSANMGTRANETFIFTASRKVHDEGLGNYVDTENNTVMVHWQFTDDQNKHNKTTKNKKFRTVIIPPISNIATNFDLRGWLKNRCIEALKEQEVGTNPLALIFPSPKGRVNNLNAFNGRVIRPASESLGWKMPPYQNADGEDMHMYRFTIHSMRDRFGTTAADEWGYSERQLLEQGSWADPQTVRKFYLGTTDETYRSVKDLHEKQLGSSRSA
jgi:hypothetical protein